MNLGDRIEFKKYETGIIEKLQFLSIIKVTKRFQLCPFVLELLTILTSSNDYLQNVILRDKLNARDLQGREVSYVNQQLLVSNIWIIFRKSVCPLLSVCFFP